MAPSKGPTAYFIFSEEHRASIHKELTAAAVAAQAQQQEDDSGGTIKLKAVSVAIVAKEIGARWRALPESEKERYKELAKQRAAEKAAADETAQVDGGVDAAVDNDQQQDKEQQEQHLSFPRGIVKRIMACDPDFRRASADAVWMISTAAEMLVGLLVERGAKQAASRKRKMLKLEDLQHVVKYDRRLVDAGLREVMEDQGMYEAAAAAAAAKAATKAASKPAADGQDNAGDAASDGAEAGGGGGKKQQSDKPQQQGPGRKKQAKQEDTSQRKLSAFFTKHD